MITSLKNFYHFYINSFKGLSQYIWFLGLVMLINRAGAMILPFMSLYMTDDLGYSYSSTGIVLAAYGVGSILGSYVGGRLTDRYNYYDIQVFSLFTSGIIVLQLTWLTSFWHLIILVFGFSFIADMFRPANAVAVSAYAKKENITRSFSLMRLAINLGYSIGPAVGGFIAVWLGYRWIFVLDGVTCIAAGFALVFLLPKKDAIKQKKEIQHEEKGIPALKDSFFIKFLFCSFLYALCFFQLFNAVPLLLKDIWNYDTDLIGLIMALNGLLIVFVEVPLISELEKKNDIFRYIIYGSFLMVISYLLLSFGIISMTIILLYTFFISISEILALPFMMNFVVSRPSIKRQGEYTALYSIAFGFAHIIAPFVGLWLAENYGFDFTFFTVSIISLIISFFFYRLAKLETKPKQHF